MRAVIVIGFSLVLLISCHRKALAQPGIINKIDTCLNTLKSYSKYWKKDSLAGNGFRELLGYRVLANCNCEGREWKDMKEYLGPPNFVYQKKGKVEYRYRLNHYEDDIKLPGTLLLDITVNKEGMVIAFIVWEVDG